MKNDLLCSNLTSKVSKADNYNIAVGYDAAKKALSVTLDGSYLGNCTIEKNDYTIKQATISSTITATTSTKHIGGFGGDKLISAFTGYPTDLNNIVGYLPVLTYYSNNNGISIRGDKSIVVHGPAAGDYIVRGILLYK